jgi:hypothetical protein
MQAYARYLDLFGPSRLKELIFTARLMPADEALAAGFVHEIVPPDALEARVRELAETIASHAPITLWVTKEAVRRLQAARALPDGDDLIATTYGSDDFREGVRAFAEKRPPALDRQIADAPSVRSHRLSGARDRLATGLRVIAPGLLCLLGVGLATRSRELRLETVEEGARARRHQPPPREDGPRRPPMAATIPPAPARARRCADRARRNDARPR